MSVASQPAEASMHSEKDPSEKASEREESREESSQQMIIDTTDKKKASPAADGPEDDVDMEDEEGNDKTKKFFKQRGTRSATKANSKANSSEQQSGKASGKKSGKKSNATMQQDDEEEDDGEFKPSSKQEEEDDEAVEDEAEGEYRPSNQEKEEKELYGAEEDDQSEEENAKGSQESDNEAQPVKRATPKARVIKDTKEEDAKKDKIQHNLFEENRLRCEIRHIGLFKTCLESVKFPTNHKNKYNDVILQALSNGIVLKSAAKSGTIMTRCMIKSNFFHAETYKIQLRNPEDIAHAKAVEKGEAAADETGKKVLLEFCLPFAELKHIVDGLVEEVYTLFIDYPVDDCYLEIKIPEESKGVADKVKNDSRLILQTYEAQHSLDADFSFKNTGVAAQFFARVCHFKKALREFNFLAEKDVISIRVSETYPFLQFVYENKKFKRFHAVRLHQDVDDFVTKQLTDNTAFYTIESLRLAFSRVSSESLLCIVTMNQEGSLSVKFMNDGRLFLTESLILAQDNPEEYEQ